LTFANTSPQVSNVTASQRTDGSGIVDIGYTLNDADSDDCTVSIEVSNDGGGGWNVAATDLSGDIGAGISPGRRHIIWKSKTDLPGEYGTNYRVKVTADDGSYTYTLNVNSSGVSGVSISSSTGHGGTTNYTKTLSSGTSVTLTAPLTAGGQTFTGWTGDVNSSDPTILFSMDGNKTVTANYVPGPSGMVWVSINDSGAGMKDGDGNPISHGGFSGQMSKYETTNAQYCQFLNAAKASGQITVYNNTVYAMSDTSHSQPYFDTYAASSYSQITYSGGTFSVRTRDGYSMANHPVVEVSWYGATAFCNYYGWRLPTEWEWQAVADYNGSYIYGCGTTINQSKANYDDANPLGLTSYPYTSPVNHYSSYGYGMNDMAGNVWEWTSSCYYTDCSGGYRVIRGGSWNHFDDFCEVSFRNISDLDFTFGYIGFRVCR